MKRFNCPNCGAPINQTECPYCGTVIYDFASIDMDKPTYLRINHNGQQYAFRAYLKSMDVSFHSSQTDIGEDFYGRVVTVPYNSADVDMEFSVIPDDEGVLFKRMEICHD